MSGTKQTCEWKVHIEVFIVKNVVHYVNLEQFSMNFVFFLFKMGYYSQTKSSVPPKNPLMNLLFKSWIRC